jgi:hypothetical protein
VRIVILVVIMCSVVTACSYATPDTSSVGLSYTGGDWESKKFNKCVPAGAVEPEDVGGYTAYYPLGVITWDFGNRPGAESGPILVSTKNNQEMIQSGTINLRLLTSCEPWTDPAGKVWPGGILQSWHENIGQRNGAAFEEDSSKIPPGWIAALSKFVGAPAERAMDQKGGDYTWQQLYSDVAIQKKFGEDVTAELPNRMKASTGNIMYWEIISVELDKPTVPDKLRDQLVEAERAGIEQQTAADKRAFQESWPGGSAAYQEFQRREAETDCIRRGQCPVVMPGVYPVPR